MSTLRVLLLACIGGLVMVATAGADGTPLNGSVGPGFTITLKDGSGGSVSHLDPVVGILGPGGDGSGDEPGNHEQQCASHVSRPFVV